MSRFIWVKDRDSREHYINVGHIVRVSKVPENASLKLPAHAYIRTDDGKEFYLINDRGYDTFEDIITKIQVAMA